MLSLGPNTSSAPAAFILAAKIAEFALAISDHATDASMAARSSTTFSTTRGCNSWPPSCRRVKTRKRPASRNGLAMCWGAFALSQRQPWRLLSKDEGLRLSPTNVRRGVENHPFSCQRRSSPTRFQLAGRLGVRQVGGCFDRFRSAPDGMRGRHRRSPPGKIGWITAARRPATWRTRFTPKRPLPDAGARRRYVERAATLLHRPPGGAGRGLGERH